MGGIAAPVINRRPGVLNDALAIQPRIDLTILVTGKPRLEAEVEPAAAYLLFCGIQNRLRVRILPGYRQLSALVADCQHRILWPASRPFAHLFPLRQNQPRWNDRKIRRKIKAERIAIAATGVGKEPPRFHEFIALGGRAVVAGLLTAVAWVYRDFARAPAPTYDLRLPPKRTRHHSDSGPMRTEIVRLEAVVDMNLPMAKNKKCREENHGL